MLIINARGVAKLNKATDKWENRDYTILVDGQMYKVLGVTKNGSLRLVPTNGFTMPTVHTPGSALEKFAQEANTQKQQTLGSMLPVEENWNILNLKVQKYMYFKDDGTPTTGLERNDLAHTLCSAVGVSDACAWNWSKPHAPKPHRKNLIGIAQFFASK